MELTKQQRQRKGDKKMNKVKSLADFHLPRWQQLPSMPLYLEQVLALL